MSSIETIQLLPQLNLPDPPHYLRRMAIHRTGKAGLARESWRRLFDFFISTRPHRDRVLERLDLTPNDSKALWTLDESGKNMRTLAAEWGCDASNATWIVDRLEQRGLAERRSVPSDRRVKLVVLTPRGATTRSAVLEEFYRPPKKLLELDRRDLEALRTALAALEGPEDLAPPGPRKSPTRASKGGRRHHD
jgi:DNA-binding MarR family transcriptional regulator